MGAGEYDNFNQIIFTNFLTCLPMAECYTDNNFYYIIKYI